MAPERRQPLRRALLAVSVCLHGGYAKKLSQVRYNQNCAARGLCSERYEFRDKTIHEAPAGSPKGHLQPLGHPDFLDSWEGEIDVFTEQPSQEKFWTYYVKKRRPFIVKGVAKNSPAMHWTDEYIMEKFGGAVAKTEWRNEDRLTDYCGQQVRGKDGKGEIVKCPKDTIPYVESRTSIRNFISQSTKNPSWDKYIISQMPDEMGKEFHVPGFVNCGKRHGGDIPKDKPWMTQLYENNFWYLRTPPKKMGTSVIHYDMNHQIMCVFRGKKEWIMWDLQTEDSKIPMWNEYYRRPDEGRPDGSDDSPIDGERVDLERWPAFAKAKWSNTTIERGDCLYTPAHLLHYVRSWSDDDDDPRNFALMTMFQTGETFDPKQCKDVPEETPLSEYDTMWGEFPGSMDVPRCMNHIKMGYPDWKRSLRALAKTQLGAKQFAQMIRREADNYPKKLLKAAWEKFQEESAALGEDATWAEKVYASKALKDLIKDVACASQGHRGPERQLTDGESWDARNEYSLAGGHKGYVDESHKEL
eukprot:TRINITY_DN64509_c0_g1_i1.p1 TRINITY_DN64509_c0_g1~~TRINITY_DN64509_c0_g1_i1.p1  ORF type:complete len:527 (+),score=111.28 TRINITY_DN64509_c0_g1_i1:76-1656(+)